MESGAMVKSAPCPPVNWVEPCVTDTLLWIGSPKSKTNAISFNQYFYRFKSNTGSGLPLVAPELLIEGKIGRPAIHRGFEFTHM